MAPQDPPDDLVAEMLKADAKNSRLRYARIGLGELLPRRPTVTAPRPNLRFLRNVLKETEGHNTALRAAVAKEQEESRAARVINARSGRSQQFRRDRSSERRGRREHERHRSNRRHRSRSPVPTGDGHHRRRYRSRSGSVSLTDAHEQRRHRPRRERSRSSERRSRKTSKKHCSPSPHSSKKGSGRHQLLGDSQSRSPSPPPKQREKSRRESHAQKESIHGDSDPLEDIIGPLPPPPIERRGRGNFTASSAMDRHFAHDYDPTLDVRLDSDEDISAKDKQLGGDWDDELERFRDRQKMRQQGADRLRQAGFTESEIKKWEHSERRGSEPDEEDVVWNKQGEGREWDRGKVVDEKGDFVQRPEWGRLKGT